MSKRRNNWRAVSILLSALLLLPWFIPFSGQASPTEEYLHARFVDCMTGPEDGRRKAEGGIRKAGKGKNECGFFDRDDDGDVDLVDWAMVERSRIVEPGLPPELLSPPPGRSFAEAMTGPGRGCSFSRYSSTWCEQKPGRRRDCEEHTSEGSYWCDSGVQPWQMFYDVDGDLDVDLRDWAALGRMKAE